MVASTAVNIFNRGSINLRGEKYNLNETTNSTKPFDFRDSLG